MTNLRPFQLILIGIFGVLALAGLIVFATFRGFTNERTAVSYGVEVWGTFDVNIVRGVLAEYGRQDRNWDAVTYVQKDSRTIGTEFTNALAEGNSPDLVFIASDALVLERNKFTPTNAVSERDFRDMFVEGAEIFRFAEGMYAFPVAVDPLVMYWNRDLFAAKGIAAPPRTWEEFVALVPRLATRSASGQLVETGAALGEYANVTNAKAILLALIMQAGGVPVIPDGRGGFSANLNRAAGQVPMPPGDAALRFYTDFASPSSAVYTWSRSYGSDRARFLSNDLGIYFGLASERRAIEVGNPNLNFDVAEVPQGAGATTLRNYGVVYGVAISRGARNPLGAFEVARGLSSEYAASIIARGHDMAPAHRSLVAAGSADPFEAILLRAALVSRGWLDPNPAVSEGIFREMIEGVTSGRLRINQATSDASQRLQYAF